MVSRFGSREICDVTFKAATNGFTLNDHEFKAGQPVFVIDTATASSMEQATTTVYAQGGKGYNRLIAWEGEKTVTFNVTDALISPLGLAMLTGAGLSDAGERAGKQVVKHIHTTFDAVVDSTGLAEVDAEKLANELGIPVPAGKTTEIEICADKNIKTYATVLDHNGAVIDWVDAVTVKTAKASITKDAQGHVTSSVPAECTVATDYAEKTIKLDFYVVMYENATEITIAPENFGGTFYVEADTLYRNQDGKDMAASLTFPKVKIQSGFTISMSPTGDPSTFDFVMDAMPGYTYFDSTKKVVCTMTIVGGDSAENGAPVHSETEHSKN